MPDGSRATRGRAAWMTRGERRPSDYHKVLLKRLKKLEARLREEFGEFESRAYVDTGPVVERSLATAAGLGWTAKNTCLIHPKLGSFVFLGVLLTSLEARAGTACAGRLPIIAAPAGAALTPVPPTRCLRPTRWMRPGASPISPSNTAERLRRTLMGGMGRQVFGCDICQDVCPWNRKAPVSADPELEPREELVNPALEALAALDEKSFEHNVQRIAGASRGICGPAAQHRHRHGQQRPTALRRPAPQMDCGGRRRPAHRRPLGAGQTGRYWRISRNS